MTGATTSQRLVAPWPALVAAFALVLCLLHPATLAAQTPLVSPSRAVVFIRVTGDLEVYNPAIDRRFQEADIELSTGSGVFISPAGHVLTAAHVIEGESGTMTLNGMRVEVKQTVRKIEVLLPAEDGGTAFSRWEATVLAGDTALDLAVVAVNGANLPFLDLGDSDALTVGDPIEAVGFPFGEMVEIGKRAAPLSSAPAPSVSRGNLSAFRTDAQGERRYVQVTAALNSGNSGGPIVDADGYLVAVASSVISSRGGGATGVGFGVSVNTAKRFLESYGIDGVLRGRRVVAGAPSSIEGKGLRVPLLVGTSDSSPVRTRVEAGTHSTDGMLLRIDRVVSAWPAARVADALTSGRAFERFTATGSVRGQGAAAIAGRVTGRASGLMDDGTPARVEYAILEAGSEKLVARFMGPPHQLAYNASILRAALRQIEMEPLRAPVRAVLGSDGWSAVSSTGTPLDRVQVPARWVVEAVGPFACQGVPAVSDAVAASPAADFTMALRAGWIPARVVSAQEAAAACGTAAGDEPGGYTRDFTFLGTRYHVEGRFVASGEGLLQLESVALAEQAPLLRAVFNEWVAKRPGPTR